MLSGLITLGVIYIGCLTYAGLRGSSEAGLSTDYEGLCDDIERYKMRD